MANNTPGITALEEVIRDMGAHPQMATGAKRIKTGKTFDANGRELPKANHYAIYSTEGQGYYIKLTYRENKFQIYTSNDPTLLAPKIVKYAIALTDINRGDLVHAQSETGQTALGVESRLHHIVSEYCGKSV